MVRHGRGWEHFLDCVTAFVIGIAIGCAVIAIDEGHWKDDSIHVDCYP